MQGTIEFLAEVVGKRKAVSLFTLQLYEDGHVIMHIDRRRILSRLFHTATDKCHHSIHKTETKKGAPHGITPTNNHQVRTNEILEGGEKVRLMCLYQTTNNEVTGLHKWGHQGANSLLR